MNKLVLITTALCLVLVTGCGSRSKPDNTSDRMYGLGLTALEIIDEYLDGKISLENAMDRFSVTSDDIDDQYDNSLREAGVEVLVGTDYANDSFINHYAGMLDYSLMKRSQGNGTDSEILEFRNSLAEKLNKSNRK